MSEIIRRLWICSAEDAGTERFVRATRATHVLNCAEECSVEEYPTGFEGKPLITWKIPMIDDEDGAEPEDIVAAAWKIHEWLDSPQGGHVVLVHCRAGISRSPTVVMAYLILHRDMTFEEAETLVRGARNFVCPISYWRGILGGLESVREAVLAAGPPGASAATTDPLPEIQPGKGQSSPQE
jgi:predicted protein tyrosine phosphatase